MTKEELLDKLTAIEDDLMNVSKELVNADWPTYVSDIRNYTKQALEAAHAVYLLRDDIKRH